MQNFDAFAEKAQKACSMSDLKTAGLNIILVIVFLLFGPLHLSTAIKDFIRAHSSPQETDEFREQDEKEYLNRGGAYGTE